MSSIRRRFLGDDDGNASLNIYDIAGNEITKGSLIITHTDQSQETFNSWIGIPVKVGDSVNYNLGCYHCIMTSGSFTISSADIQQGQVSKYLAMPTTKDQPFTLTVNVTVNGEPTDAVIIFKPSNTTLNHTAPTPNDSNPGALCTTKKFIGYDKDCYILYVIKDGYIGYRKDIIFDKNNPILNIELDYDSDELTKYLTFRAHSNPQSGFKIVWRATNTNAIKTIYYSTKPFSSGEWTSWTAINSSVDGSIITVPANSYCRVKGYNTTYGVSTTDYSYFEVTESQGQQGDLIIFGDITSLLLTSGTDAKPDSTYVLASYAFPHLFSGRFFNSDIYDLTMGNITDYSGDSCCYYMFANSSIERPPQMTISVLGNNACRGMFNGCSNLLYSPLITGDFATYSCYSMFGSCGWLKKIFCYSNDISASNSHYDFRYMGTYGIENPEQRNESDSCAQRIFYCSSSANWPTTGRSGIPQRNDNTPWDISYTVIDPFKCNEPTS